MTDDEKRELAGRCRRLIEQKGDTIKAPDMHRRLRYEDDAITIEWTTYEGPFPAPDGAFVTNGWACRAKVRTLLGDQVVGLEEPPVASQHGSTDAHVYNNLTRLFDLGKHVLEHLRKVMDE